MTCYNLVIRYYEKKGYTLEADKLKQEISLNFKKLQPAQQKKM